MELFENLRKFCWQFEAVFKARPILHNWFYYNKRIIGVHVLKYLSEVINHFLCENELSHAKLSTITLKICSKMQIQYFALYLSLQSCPKYMIIVDIHSISFQFRFDLFAYSEKDLAKHDTLNKLIILNFAILSQKYI